MPNELKPCPFCGGAVHWERTASRAAIYDGECIECSMCFHYEEKEERNIIEQMNGSNVIVQYILPSYKRLNLPFSEAWNRRADNG